MADMTKMSKSAKNSYFDRLKGSIAINEDQERKFMRDIADGRKKKLKYKFKRDMTLADYQEAQDFDQLDLQAVDKFKYLNQFGRGKVAG